MRLMVQRSVAWLLAGMIGLSLCYAPALQAKVLSIVYPQPESKLDTRPDYFVRVLALALSKSGVQYELHAHEIRMTQVRALRQLEQNDGIDVAWTMTSKERESALLPIRIPLDKGLFGWRIFLINPDEQQIFSNITTLQQLRPLSAGQGYDWPDVPILQANQLTVVPGTNYEALFRMLQARRFQYFPRSILEIWDEQKNHQNLGLVIEKKLALHYPTCLYFFVNKQNKNLAALLERGLHQAIRDGSFQRLFDE
ncbi:MAG: hypothetical protein KGM99_20405, partial [Burkholderiales bacterium]|nr:hypothetical protein [Burkholderiales bacterium]